MKRKISFFTLMLIFVFANTFYAQNKPYRVGTTACNFLEIGVGGAGNAMGDAYVSITGDLSSVYWNPAGLAYLEQTEVQFMYQPWYVDTNVSFAGAGIVLPRIGTLGLNILSMDFGRTEVTTLAMQEGTGETFSAGDYAVSLSYGRKLAHWFGFGASVKWVSSNIWHVSANALALDLGVIVNTHFFSFTGDPGDGMTIGMSISNYGTKVKYDGIDLLIPVDILPDENGNYRDLEAKYSLQGWELPLIFRVGTSITPIVRENQKLTLAVDALHPNNNSESVNLGGEYMMRVPGFGRFYLRGGYRGMFMDESQFGLTLGGGIHLTLMGNRLLKIDYAFKESEFLGNSSVYTIGVTF
jgi:hypothetical protein